MYNKLQGRNNHGRTIVAPNLPKHQPVFAVLGYQGPDFKIDERGLYLSVRPGVWHLVWPGYRPYYMDVAAARNYDKQYA